MLQNKKKVRGPLIKNMVHGIYPSPWIKVHGRERYMQDALIVMPTRIW